MFELVKALGSEVTHAIISTAKLLTQEYIPGLISLGLLFLLFISTVLYLRNVYRRTGTLKWVLNVIQDHKTPQDFTENILIIDQKIRSKWKDRKFKNVVTAWVEYRETLVNYGEGSNRHLRNSVRPSTFLNPEDLQYGPGFWKIVPGLFVTVGLFLTFLGLVAALSALNVSNADPAELKNSLDALLKTASAKFIMSLTGLFCSICFTIVVRYGIGKVEDALHNLCTHTEHLLKFMSLEDVAIDQLDAIKEQREHFRTIGMELVAELGRPLREELPQTIAKSISDSMAPMVDQVAKVGSEGVDNMVQDLSKQLSNEVGVALSNASKSIQEAGKNIEDLSMRMDESSGNLNKGLSTSIADLTKAIEDIRDTSQQSVKETGDLMNQGAERWLSLMSKTLQDIKENTGEGARAISQAAAEMHEAAENFNTEISNAAKDGALSVSNQMVAAGDSASEAIAETSQNILHSFVITAETISENSQKMADRLSAGLLDPLNSIGTSLETLNRDLNLSTSEFRRLAEGVKMGADASLSASDTFKGASQSLVSATDPIRASVERLDLSASKLQDSTEKTSEIMLAGASSIIESAETSLQSIVKILNTEQNAVQASLAGVNTLVERMKGQGEKLDDIDNKLGVAFEEYAKHIGSALELMLNHTRQMQEELTPAVDVLREVVDQAEQFIPESRITRK